MSEPGLPVPAVPAAGLGDHIARHAGTLFWLALALLIAGLIVLPLGFVADSSLHADGRFGLLPGHTLQTLINVYTGREYLEALKEAAVLAAVVTVGAVATGVALALLVGRCDLPGGSWLNLLVVMPMFLSPFNGLIAWILLGSEKTGLLNLWIGAALEAVGAGVGPLFNIFTWTGAVWVMTLFFTPYIFLFTIANLRSMDSSLEEAARACGATGIQTLFRVTLPMCLPAILAAALLVFILSSELYTIPGVIGITAGFKVLPWIIYENSLVPPLRQAHAAAAATMLLLATVIGVIIQRRITRHSEKFVTITGKGRRSRPLQLGRYRWVALAFVWLYIVASTILPLATLVLSSLMKYNSPTFAADVFTLQHYRDFLASGTTRGALLNTLMLAVGASLVCMVIGTVISYGEVRSRRTLPRLLAFLCVLPVAVPGIVYGVGLHWVYLKTPFYGTVLVLLLAYVAKFMPYSVMVSRSGVMQIHPELEQCARVCGAGPLRSLAQITGPLMGGSLVAIVFFVMLLSVKEISASLLLYTQRSETLSVLTWSNVEAGNFQFAAAIGVVQTVFIVLLVSVVRIVFNIRLEQEMGRKGGA